MSRTSLQGMSIEQLVQRFATLASEQDIKLLQNDIAATNRLFDKIQNVAIELKGRQGDQRRALMVLYDHPNMQVRLKAALNTLSVAPQAARKQLESIRESKWQPYAGDAGMSLRNLDNGIFRPT